MQAAKQSGKRAAEREPRRQATTQPASVAPVGGSKDL